MKIRLLIELDYDPELMHGDDEEARRWFFEDVLAEDLLLHSSNIGDTIGEVNVLRVIEEAP